MPFMLLLPAVIEVSLESLNQNLGDKPSPASGHTRSPSYPVMNGPLADSDLLLWHVASDASIQRQPVEMMLLDM